ncbi:MAG: flavodoxin [Fibrobacter sp.]|nr:flavodoxin [Fibrobacter sp.]
MRKIVLILLMFLIGVSMAADKKILIAYFSHIGENVGLGMIAKGNTEIVAEMIAERTGGTLLEVKPVTAYPRTYDECLKVAKKELAQNARPEIKPMDINPEDFDEIYIGYPVWLNEMPMLMYTFLEKYNLKGKLVHPFVTHEGSGLSAIAKLKKAATGAVVTKGLSIYGHIAQNNRKKAQKDVDKWLKFLGVL